MTKGLWIWKSRLTEVLKAISDMANVEFSLSSLDRIKYGIVGTSEVKDNWFDFGIGKIVVRLAVDNDDNDIIHFQITELDEKSINRLSDIGTKE